MMLIQPKHRESATLRYLQSQSVSYRIALGPQAGRKALVLKTLPPLDEWDYQSQTVNVNGFSLHAGVAASHKQRNKIERLCRYVTRAPVSEKRIALTTQGQVRYCLKTPYKDGTTHVVLAPLDFIARLAALIPKPRVNLIRYHGVLAPNARHRGEITPSGRGRGGKAQAQAHPRRHEEPTKVVKVDWKDKTPVERHQAMRWAQRLKRVFNIDVETCVNCGGQVKVIACIEDPVVIQKILDHQASRQESLAAFSALPRGPPQRSFFD